MKAFGKKEICRSLEYQVYLPSCNLDSGFLDFFGWEKKSRRKKPVEKGPANLWSGKSRLAKLEEIDLPAGPGMNWKLPTAKMSKCQNANWKQFELRCTRKSQNLVLCENRYQGAGKVIAFQRLDYADCYRYAACCPGITGVCICVWCLYL